jgi:hypothetical protein
MRNRRSAMVVAACTVIAAAAAGCGSSGGQSAAAVPTATTSSRPAQHVHAIVTHRRARSKLPPAPRSRPREQLDESSSQLQALDAPYDQCLAAHAPHSSHYRDVPRYKLAGPAAMRACLPYKPLPPWQYDSANPKALGFVEKVVACLHQHGVRYAQVTNPAGAGRIEIALGGAGNDQTSILKGMTDIPVCDQLVLRSQGG